MSAAMGVQRGQPAPRLGDVLVRAEIVSSEALEHALVRQARVNSKLGELLVEMRLIDRIELDAVLALQQELKDGRVQPVLELLGRRLGSILLASGVVSEERLTRALREHERTHEMLGEILVRQG